MALDVNGQAVGTATALNSTFGSTPYFNISGMSYNMASTVDDTGYTPFDHPTLYDNSAILASMLSGSDVVNGSDSADRLAGFNGNDTVYGNAGNDSIEGGGGDDSLYGGVGFDTLTGGSGNDRLVGEDGDDYMTGGLGNDTLDGGAGTDWANYSGAASAITVNLAAASNHVVGGDGTDQLIGIEFIRGTNFNDSIRGNNADNFFTGGQGNDTLDGGVGFDWADYQPASGAVTVNLSLTSNQATGADGIDQLTSIEGIRGSNFNDVLTGNAADNWIRGGRGNDTIDGGAGFDWADYRNAFAGVTVNLGLSSAQATGADGTDQLLNIEAVRGGAFNDSLTGNSSDNFLRGAAGNDTLDGGAGTDTADYRDATASISVNLALATNQVTSAEGTDTLISIERIRGSVFDDLFVGDALDNNFRGMAGNDTINGGGGFDYASYWDAAGAVTVNLGAMSNQATGADGTDQLISIEGAGGGAFNDTLIGDAADNFFGGNGGNDTINGGAGNDWAAYRDATGAVTVNLTLTSSQATGADGTDQLISIENVEGSSFADLLRGNSGNNTLRGRGGNDTLDGGLGFDQADFRDATGAVSVNLSLLTNHATGGDGTDQLISIESVRGSRFNDTLTGDGFANRLDGSDGDDTLNGGAGADTLIGGLGINWFSGNQGADRYEGGGGLDVVFFEDGTQSVTANLQTGVITNDGFGNQETAVSVENIHGSRFADNIVLSTSGYAFGRAGNDTLLGGGGNNALIGGSGSDNLNGGGGFDTVDYVADFDSAGAATQGVTVNLATGQAVDNWGFTDTLAGIEAVVGTALNDRLTGDANANSLTGQAGADTLDGGAGIDSMTGGDGSDAYYVRDIGDVVTETNAASTGGADIVYSYLSSYILGTNVEYGRILNTGAASLTGNTLNNILYAGAGSNTLNGSTGTDTVSYLYGATGTTGVTVTLASTAAQATGGSGTDTLLGIENLTGSNNADNLTGSAGNNVLTGGLGKDTLTGGAGNDIFDFNALTEMGITSSTWDVITDFTRGLDKIDLSTLDANTATTINDAFNGTLIASNAAFTAAGQLKLVGNVLYGNTDADATEEFAIELTGIAALSSADFVL